MRWRKPKHLAFAALVAALLAGCATSRPHLSLDDIVQMSHDGKPAEEIIQALRETRTTYPLTASRLLSLRDEGVDPSVLDHLLNTYAESIRFEERMRYHGWFVWHHCFGCYHGPVMVTPR